ncbi:MAG TPA: DinB family protein [Blastocatellia bacterium]|nr:DinB family protein [Blastocatellia bacterium]
MSIEALINGWKDVRNGFLEEVELVPADKFDFKPADECRSLAELLQHIVQTQRVLVGELCRPDTNLGKGFPALIAEHASGVDSINDKEGLIKSLAESMDDAALKIQGFGAEALNEPTTRFDGKQSPKVEFLNFIMAHEMYHRGQFTVYQRLLGIEPALTTRFKKLFATQS